MAPPSSREVTGLVLAWFRGDEQAQVSLGDSSYARQTPWND
ncbi:MAG TPA: hypothetical protein VEI01_25205 [Terriglobales bacterium]|nr:hypothetical protein [Terriglobales bacterium]